MKKKTRGKWTKTFPTKEGHYWGYTTHLASSPMCIYVNLTELKKNPGSCLKLYYNSFYLWWSTPVKPPQPPKDTLYLKKYK